MEHLKTLDAGFLEAEDSDEHANLAIGGLAILEGPMPDHDSLMATLGERISVCPRFAQRLRRRPFDLGAPEWVDDDDFDLANHVCRVAVPAGRAGRRGTQSSPDEELFGLVAELMSWRMDRSRPLWEIWVIEGLTGNRWALLMKIHHCVADGIATAHILAGLSDEGIGPRSGGRVCPGHELRDSHKSSASGPAGLAALTKAVIRAAWGAGELAAGLLRPAPTTSLNGPLSSLRRYSATRVSLKDVRRVCAAYDVTVNDVALAAITESYRSMLIRRGEWPLPESLRTLVPVSTRSADASGITDNRVSLMLPYLPVDEDHPVRRLRLVHSRLSRTKAAGQHQAGSALISVANCVPFSLTAWAMRLLTRLPQRSVVTLATNVPGPQEKLTIMGRPVTAVMPIPPLALQMRTGVAVLSYADDLFFGVLADFEAPMDVDEFVRGLEAAVARLVARSRHPTARCKHRGLSLVVSA